MVTTMVTTAMVITMGITTAVKTALIKTVGITGSMVSHNIPSIIIRLGWKFRYKLSGKSGL